MLLLLLSAALLGAPDVLVVLRAPTAPGVLRDQVWPAFAADQIGRWQIRAVPLDRLAARVPDAAGAIWADLGPDGRVRLHRVLFDAATHLVDPVALPPDAASEAVTDAMRLRLRFLLEAPTGQGEAWTPTPAPPPKPAPFQLPEEHRVDLALVRAPPVARRIVRIPAPPPPLSVEPPGSDMQAPPTPASATWIGLGFDGLADLDGLDGGLLVEVAIPIGVSHLALHGALHPFHDFERDGRPLGVTGYRAALSWGTPLWARSEARVDLRAGLGVRGLTVSGAGAQTTGVDPLVTLSTPLRIALRAPFAVGLDAGLVLAPSAARAWHSSGTLVERSVVQARVGVLMQWGLP